MNKNYQLFEQQFQIARLKIDREPTHNKNRQNTIGPESKIAQAETRLEAQRLSERGSNSYRQDGTGQRVLHDDFHAINNGNAFCLLSNAPGVQRTVGSVWLLD